MVLWECCLPTHHFMEIHRGFLFNERTYTSSSPPLVVYGCFGTADAVQALRSWSRSFVASEISQIPVANSASPGLGLILCLDQVTLVLSFPPQHLYRLRAAIGAHFLHYSYNELFIKHTYYVVFVDVFIEVTSRWTGAEKGKGSFAGLLFMWIYML